MWCTAEFFLSNRDYNRGYIRHPPPAPHCWSSTWLSSASHLRCLLHSRDLKPVLQPVGVISKPFMMINVQGLGLWAGIVSMLHVLYIMQRDTHAISQKHSSTQLSWENTNNNICSYGAVVAQQIANLLVLSSNLSASLFFWRFPLKFHFRASESDA